MAYSKKELLQFLESKAFDPIFEHQAGPIQLDRLKLSKLPDLKDEFLELCQRLGVSPRS